MRQQPSDLAIEHADELRALGHREAEQLFRRQAEGMLLVHRRDIVELIQIGDRLQIGLGLDQHFGAAMQETDVRVDALDHLTVKLQHQPQHAVGRGMLRPEVDGEVAGGRGSRRLRPDIGGEGAGGRVVHCFAFSSPGSG